MSFWSPFWCLLGPFWPPFWGLLGAQIGRSSAQDAPRSPQDAPRRPPDRSRALFSFKIRMCQKVLKNLRKINDFGLSSRLHIAPRWPQAWSRLLKIGPRRLQDDLDTVLKGICSLLKIDFDLVLFWDRFWLHLGSQNASLLAPFWRSKLIKKTVRNRTALKVAPRPLQDRPRASQDAPRTPSDPLKTPQDPTKTPPKSLPGRSWTVLKIENFDIVENMSKKSRPWSPTMVTQYHRSKESKVSSQQSNPRGWRRWSREALFNKSKHSTCSDTYLRNICRH
jgi:hypothetical protein